MAILTIVASASLGAVFASAGTYLQRKLEERGRRRNLIYITYVATTYMEAFDVILVPTLKDAVAPLMPEQEGAEMNGTDLSHSVISAIA